eukprot:95699-Rhodomonas_salina.1
MRHRREEKREEARSEKREARSEKRDERRREQHLDALCTTEKAPQNEHAAETKQPDNRTRAKRQPSVPQNCPKGRNTAQHVTREARRRSAQHLALHALLDPHRPRQQQCSL